jgi:hypothetical protein
MTPTLPQSIVFLPSVYVVTTDIIYPPFSLIAHERLQGNSEINVRVKQVNSKPTITNKPQKNYFEVHFLYEGSDLKRAGVN